MEITFQPPHKCIRCEHVLPVSKFWSQRSGKPNNVCKSCTAKTAKVWKSKNPERIRAYSRNWYRRNPIALHRHKLMYRYGISLEEFDEKLKQQKFCCAICKEKEKKHQHLSVDHDHTTGINRGLLCDRCNRSLGGFRDSVLFLSSAIEYLKKWGPQ
jgi:hypothetical protein